MQCHFDEYPDLLWLYSTDFIPGKCIETLKFLKYGRTLRPLLQRIFLQFQAFALGAEEGQCFLVGIIQMIADILTEIG